MLEDYAVNEGKLPVKLDKLKQFSRLDGIALDDYKFEDNSGKDKYSAAEICQRIEVPYSNCKRTWEPKFRALQKPLDRLAATSLPPVAARLNQLATLETNDHDNYIEIAT